MGSLTIEALDVNLSDDEFVAVLRAADINPGLRLPTVDTSDAPAIDAAALRGIRSLALRGLLQDDGRVDPDLAFVAETCRPEVRRLTMFLGDENLHLVSYLGYQVAWRSETKWLLQGVSPLGVSSFRMTLSSDLERAMVESAELVGSAGPNATGDRLRVCLAGVKDGHARVVAQSSVSLVVATQDRSGAESELRSIDNGDAASAIRGLLTWLES